MFRTGLRRIGRSGIGTGPAGRVFGVTSGGARSAPLNERMARRGPARARRRHRPKETNMADRKSALKHLHTRLHDSVDGYEAALERTDSPYIKNVIEDMLTRRRTAVAEVHKYLSGMGVEVDHDGSLLGDAHRGFLKLKDAVTGGGDDAVMEEIVRGEESLADAYETAIDEAGGTDPEFMWLQQQHAAVKAKVEEFRARKAA